MAQEEQTKKCNTSSDGNGDGGFRSGHISRSSRKHKQKKVPQRGLGVAQLEKIRLEEQQKNDVSVNLPSPASISQIKPSNRKIRYLSMPIPNVYESRSTSIPYLPDLSSPNSMFRPQNIELINSNSTIPSENSVGWQSAAVQGQKNVPKMWNSSDYNLEKENCGVDPALAFRSNLNLPYESNPIWPLPSLMQRAQQHGQHSSSSSCSMVNASSGSSSSSLQNPQMEPPSNQSYYDNYVPVWIEEEKMVSKKRPHPFSLGYPPGSSSHCYKCPTNTSFGNGGLYNFSFSSRNCREDSSCSTCILEPTSKKIIKENGACNADFLTPAPPPATTLTSTDFKLKPSAYLDFHNFESFDFDSLPYQGNVEDRILQQPGAIVPNQQQTYYCFLPPAIMQIGHPTKSSNDYTGDEVGENIDLNLKL
ncbi:hypothetical protein POPTR_001G375600v4 [Populus trichocarpa]|uniref:Uncharacterized protein n=1 Tax=Populus trichocarpa TaxID=3694 RepID=A0ACC0TNL5_POPTR|nr:uncharacterized protein LOC7487580 isoform X2 [Populus trichocarpa]KAI9403126.1 hypothetical protein POPTR_001G375600v4 [Populus trichocarpa]